MNPGASAGGGGEALLLDQQLCFALHSASRAVTRAYGPLLEPLGLTYPQYLVLLVLWEEGAVSIKHLGERLTLDSGTRSPLCKRLEQAGLLIRSRAAEDERSVRVELTAKGRKLRARARRIPAAIACRAGIDVTGAEGRARVRELRRALLSLRDYLENGG